MSSPQDVGATGRRGLMLVLSSPSGAGKSTLARLLVEKEKARGRPFHLSVSVTTREKRPSEVEGVHYHFISPARFEAMRERGELLEWAEVHGNLYATPREPVVEALATGRDMLFDIDVQGTEQLCKQMREDVVSVFILPPSIGELRARLERRAEDADEVIARRLTGAKSEMEHWTGYDYVIVNTDVEEAFSGLQAILDAERLRRTRNPGLADYVRKLQSDL